MPDDLAQPPQDESRINLDDEAEVRWWMHSLGVSREVLESAAKAVGTNAAAVKKYVAERAYS